jgi:hypothetical protein
MTGDILQNLNILVVSTQLQMGGYNSFLGKNKI